jgi:putative ABC transport system permease protein
MLKNYLKITLRNLRKHKSYSFINITGLAVGMASTILILLWVQDELSFDRFHQNADRIYRIIDYEKYSNGEEVTFSMNPPALASALKDEYPEILDVVRIRKLSNAVAQYGDKCFSEDAILFADPTFLKIFSFPLVNGNEENALINPRSIVITEKMALKYFGKEHPVGKIIRIDNRLDFLITGIMKDVPKNSHLQFNFVMSFETIKEFGFPIEGWNSFAYTTYVLLAEKSDYRQVSKKIAGLIKTKQEEAIVTLSLQPLPDIHLHSGNIWGIGGTGDIKYVYIFTVIAGFILLLACINFMNLTTARASNRAKEVGLRKVVGADRKDLIKQFFSESILFALLSLLIAIILVVEALPFYNILSGKEMVLDVHNNQINILLLVSITIITGLVSGSYPALFLSSFKPVSILKGVLKSGTKSSSMRKILVSFQFSLTIVLIIGTIIINRQLHFIKNQRLGFEKDQVLCLKLPGNLNQKIDLICTELSKNQQVIEISAVSFPPAQIRRSTIVSEWEGRQTDDQFLMYMLSADFDFLNTMGIAMAEGRYFSRKFPADTSTGIVVNEAAVNAMNMENPIGKKLFDLNIIGVVRDFHFNSLHSHIGPLVIYYNPNEIQNLLIKVKPDDFNQTIKSIEHAWNRVVPGFPFEYSFLGEQIDLLYKAEQRVGKVINTFSILALFIACLGLFGMASFTAEQRTKEVGIRKVHGATVPGIVMLLAREFTRYVLFANIAAWPIAYYAMNKWLQEFAYRIDLTIWPFLLAGLSAFVIALLTVSWQSIRAAMANPIESLRYE